MRLPPSFMAGMPCHIDHAHGPNKQDSKHLDSTQKTYGVRLLDEVPELIVQVPL